MEQTAPLIGFYRERGLLVEIDGERSVGEVQSALLEAIRRL
jgi:adenylate kinase